MPIIIFLQLSSIFAFLSLFINECGCYIMPICREQCMDECTQDKIENANTKTSDLFFFVTDTMDVIRNIVYNKVIPFFIYQKPKPRDLSYIDSMWTFFGFHVESEPPPDDEYAFCNGSIFALIFVLYFGYLFMATKCVNGPKTYEGGDSRFLSYLVPTQEDETDDVWEKEVCHCHHHHHDSENEKDEMCMIPYDADEYQESLDT